MKKATSLLILASSMFSAASYAAETASTLDEVKSRGYMNCVIGNSFPGFYSLNKEGEWQGMDIDMCRSVSAAVFGDSSKVKFLPVQWAQSFTSIKSGKGDMLSKGMTWTLSRDTQQGLDFLDTYFYDGQGFMVRKDLGVDSVYDLEGATVCVLTGTSSELNIADFSRANNLDLKTVVFDDSSVRNTAFFNDNCDALTNDKSGLAAQRSAAQNPDDYIVLPETISKEALSFAVKQNDSEWANVVKWTFAAMVAAEEYGITSDNVDQMRSESNSPVVRRLLGVEGNLNTGLGLPQDWAYQVIKSVGNYGEVYERNVGPNSVLGLKREGTLNALWKDGGMMYAKSFR
ncbi:amino acid ABC transporter substrate-binding protein [Marinomonas mediterranea]|jgi:ABC-type amino acid transport/signal transduction systems, periplasmic component/domain|uniref:ABC-type transporter, periplasmic subunit family 3 n=1 Tax=Marinomonas mediterranea (strain ATCC 700492 / JCM 21426 / NBRC 103028 / MMB-1) TaxID=717774 RepID=F2JZT4_MARM1|nr:amino acid ABC transporter substrate-binding protein [Marinomonas mediterranea]ADZ90938.1 ABC-type transporter, periplasmic subunit family 3 [Marinomonas mediterranea MMB-1]WCN08974.1 transporter substrate-binding domain-containing protein [Marinomonas mediterranea]WCN13009.1 transporter substrate-binding domain-containing protein [Marinomonas mediterranea]WCN17082.1 transporter substrate-binding domain-containing protein [Marinomonas mediterranea MMB-1]